MVYGATGFSGRAIAARLRDAGHEVVLAGRNPARLREMAAILDTPYRVFGLGEAGPIEHGLADIRVVVHAAGPFAETAGPMIGACIRTGTHYLDLAGEWPVFALAQQRGPEAADTGTMLMPGVGFSIVVSDCLLAHAAQQVRSASLLRVAISAPGIMSRGTFRSALGLTGPTVIVRREGVVRHLPVGRLQRRFNFGAGEKTSVAVSWPDVITGQHTTGVASIEAYAEADLLSRLSYRAGALAAGAFGSEAVRRVLQPLSAAWPEQPSVEQRRTAGHSVVVEAIDPWRRVTSFGLRTLDGYSVTTITAGAIVERVLDGDHVPGFQTPAGRYGADFIRRLGCAWEFDVGPSGV